MKHQWMTVAVSVAAAVISTSVSAETLHADVESTVVGQTSTGNQSSGGDPRWFATAPRYSGVVSLIMRSGTNASICTGSLLADRRSILTAAHCVSGGAGTANPTTTMAYFYNGANPDAQPYTGTNATGTVAVGVSQYFVNSAYTGEVIDNNDIAVLRLAEAAPDFALDYELYDGTDLTGLEFNVAGYGSRSSAGGSVGANLGVGVRRQGNNTFDFRTGDAAFNGGLLTALGGGSAARDQVYLADFDNGTAARDSGCLVSRALGVADNRFCNTGLGLREASIAGGDSGSSSFIDNRIATVSSFGLSFGTSYGDIDNALNFTFGEMGGYVPVSIHREFIRSSMLPAAAVPEPATWSMMILGIGVAGGAMRRRAKARIRFAA